MSLFPPMPLLLVVAALTGTCAAPVSPPSAQLPAADDEARGDAEGLIVLTGGSILLGDNVGRFEAVEGPRGRLASISASTGRLIAETDGPTFHLAILGPALTRPVWRGVDIDVQSLAHPPTNPSISPNGTQLALLSADVENGGPFDLVVRDLRRSRRQEIRIEAEANGPPVWLDEARIVVEVASDGGDDPRFLVVDLASASSTPTSAGGRGPAISGDGSLVALIGGESVVAATTENWLAADPPAGSEAVGTPEMAFAVAVDATGRRIAIGHADAAGEPASIEIFRHGPAGWISGAAGPRLVSGGPTAFDWLN